MKKLIISMIVAASIGAASLASTLAAPFTVRIRAEIPFDFNVGKKKLPKGEYLIESVGDSGTLAIRNADKGKSVVFNTIRSKPTDGNKAKLVFHRYGDQYFLARVWDQSSETILKLNKSSLEKRIAKQLKKENNPDEVNVSDK
ncbi:MAG TPA: hypothetical protein VFY40_11675 [Blastocatellia bacterium]|nr:hypothetical protein [Blastocatellia bacterium]